LTNNALDLGSAMTLSNAWNNAMFVISKLRRTSDFNSHNLPLRIGNNINFIQDVVHSALPWAVKGTKFELLYMPQRNKMMQPWQFSTI